MGTLMAERPQVGRPPIGPKVQTAAPEDCYANMEEEARKRGVRVAVIVREVIVAGCAVRYGRGES